MQTNIKKLQQEVRKESVYEDMARRIECVKDVMASDLDAFITKAESLEQKVEQDSIEDLLANHDCHASAEDGCACGELVNAY